MDLLSSTEYAPLFYLLYLFCKTAFSAIEILGGPKTQLKRSKDKLKQLFHAQQKQIKK